MPRWLLRVLLLLLLDRWDPTDDSDDGPADRERSLLRLLLCLSTEGERALRVRLLGGYFFSEGFFVAGLLSPLDIIWVVSLLPKLLLLSDGSCCSRLPE